LLVHWFEGAAPYQALVLVQGDERAGGGALHFGVAALQQQPQRRDALLPGAYTRLR